MLRRKALDWIPNHLKPLQTPIKGWFKGVSRHILATNQCSSINQLFGCFKLIEITMRSLSRRIFSTPHPMFRTEFPLKKHSTRDYLGELKNHSETERLELEGFSNKKDTPKTTVMSHFCWDWWSSPYHEIAVGQKDAKVTIEAFIRWRPFGGWFNDDSPPPWSSKKLRAGTGLAERRQVSWCVKSMWVTGPWNKARKIIDIDITICINYQIYKESLL